MPEWRRKCLRREQNMAKEVEVEVGEDKLEERTRWSEPEWDGGRG